MKTKFLALSLLGAALIPAQAQVFRPEIVNGAALGALAGAVIGHQDGRHGREGAAYGAAAGALIGAIAANANEAYHHGNTQVTVPAAPRRAEDWTGGSRAVQGALLGGVAGAIIGNNSGRHDGGRGAAIGAATGLVLGAIADANAAPAPVSGADRGHRGYYEAYYDAPRHGGYRPVLSVRPGIVRYPGYSYGRVPHRGYSHGRGRDWGYWGIGWPVITSRPVVVETVREVPVAVSAPAPTPAPQQITIINNYYGAATPMSSANSLFGR